MNGLPPQTSLIADPCRVPGCPRRGAHRRGLCDDCYQDRELRGRYAAPDRRPQAKPCVHCKVEKQINRPRGLCWSCYYTPGVKDQYQPIMSPGARGGYSGAYRGLGLDYSAGPMPEPTAALPGTVEKLRVLMARAEKGEQLWHPLDRRLGDAATTPGEAADLLLSHGW